MKWEATKTKTKAALLAARCELIKQVKHVPLQFQFFIAFFIYFFFCIFVVFILHLYEISAQRTRRCRPHRTAAHWPLSCASTRSMPFKCLTRSRVSADLLAATWCGNTFAFLSAWFRTLALAFFAWRSLLLLRFWIIFCAAEALFYCCCFY